MSTFFPNLGSNRYTHSSLEETLFTHAFRFSHVIQWSTLANYIALSPTDVTVSKDQRNSSHYRFQHCKLQYNLFFTSLCFKSYKYPQILLYVPGPANWPEVCKTGTRQSPIDIKSSEAVYDNALGEFVLHNYDKKLPLNFTVKNNGHGMVVSLAGGNYTVSGGGLVGSYKTVQFHLHWGPNNDEGSEHVVNGNAYPAEVRGARNFVLFT